VFDILKFGQFSAPLKRGENKYQILVLSRPVSLSFTIVLFLCLPIVMTSGNYSCAYQPMADRVTRLGQFLPVGVFTLRLFVENYRSSSNIMASLIHGESSALSLF
jgi:hypothetical protein